MATQCAKESMGTDPLYSIQKLCWCVTDGSGRVQDYYQGPYSYTLLGGCPRGDNVLINRGNHDLVECQVWPINISRSARSLLDSVAPLNSAEVS